MSDPKKSTLENPELESFESSPTDEDEVLRHHEMTGTTSVKKLDDTPPLRPGKLEGAEELEDDVHMYGTGGSRPGIGLPDHTSDGPKEAMEVDGVLGPKGSDSK